VLCGVEGLDRSVPDISLISSGIVTLYGSAIFLNVVTWFNSNDQVLQKSVQMQQVISTAEAKFK
jgi:hypothetical protein